MAPPPSVSVSDSTVMSSRNAIIAARQKKMKCRILILTHKPKSRDIALEVVLRTQGIEDRSLPLNSYELKLVGVGVGVDWTDLLKRLKKKLGDAEMLSLSEVDDNATSNCTII